MVLYNKYTATLRVFGAHHNIGDYDYMAVYLEFAPADNADITGLLNPTQQIARPLDLRSLPIVHANAEITGNNSSHFFYADFPMGYDPCTCIFEDKAIKVTFEAINKQKLSIYGRSWAIDNDLANIVGGKGQVNEDYLMNVYSDNNTGETAGSLTFNTWSGLVTHYENQKLKAKQLSKQYEAFKDLKKALEWATFASGLPGNLLPFPLVNGTDTNYVKFEDLKNPVKIASKFVDVLGAPIKKKLDGANSAAASYGKIRMIQSEIALSGEITEEIPKEGFRFYVPGLASNKDDCDDALGPLYDEVLGRFTLLEAPQVKVGSYNEVIRPLCKVTVKERIQLDVSSLQNNFLFNPAANVDLAKTQIYGALVIKKSIDPNPAFSVHNHHLNNLDTVPGLSNSDSLVMITRFVPLECLGNLTAEIDLSNIKETNLYRPNVVSHLDIQLRLIIFYEFNSINSQGLKNQAFEVLTYDVTPTPTPYSSISPPITNAGGINIKDELTLGTTNYTTSQTVFAWNEITVSGSLTAAPNVQVEIVAPNIVLGSGASIGSGIQLINREYPVSCPSLSQFNVANLSTYCSQGNYEANKPTFTKTQEIISERDIKELNYTTSPNPFKDNTQLRFTLPVYSEVSITVYNTLGQQVKTVLAPTELSEGEYNYTLDGSNLPAGIYYATIRWDGGIQTKSIIKQ